MNVRRKVVVGESKEWAVWWTVNDVPATFRKPSAPSMAQYRFFMRTPGFKTSFASWILLSRSSEHDVRARDPLLTTVWGEKVLCAAIHGAGSSIPDVPIYGAFELSQPISVQKLLLSV